MKNYLIICKKPEVDSVLRSTAIMMVDQGEKLCYTRYIF